MAERRMFAKSIVLSGPFIRLPAKSQLLYFHLGMQADDEGFISAPELALRAAGATRRDLNHLVDAEYLIPFDSGLLVMRHWFLHNNIKKDRFRPTVYQTELKRLSLEDKVYQMEPQGNQSGSMAEPQIKQNKRKENETRKKEIILNQTREGGSGSLPGNGGQTPRSPGDGVPDRKEVMCYAFEKNIRTNASAFYDHYCNLGWPGDSRYSWKILLNQWEEEYAGTS